MNRLHMRSSLSHAPDQRLLHYLLPFLFPSLTKNTAHTRTRSYVPLAKQQDSFCGQCYRGGFTQPTCTQLESGRDDSSVAPKTQTYCDLGRHWRQGQTPAYSMRLISTIDYLPDPVLGALSGSNLSFVMSNSSLSPHAARRCCFCPPSLLGFVIFSRSCPPSTPRRQTSSSPPTATLACASTCA